MTINIPLYGSYVYNLPCEIKETLLNEEYYKNYKHNNPDQPSYGSFLNLSRKKEEFELFEKLNEFYSPIIDRFMNDIGQYKNSNYKWEIWWQIYEPNSSGFKIHKHCGKKGDPNVISFNHFVKTIPERSFFNWVFGNRFEIPHEEKEGEIIFFAGHAFHRVDKNDTDDIRLTISGNIYMIDSLGYYENGEYP
jgi:hypothetical protein